MSEYLTFRPDTPERQILRRWHARLSDQRRDGKVVKGDRAGRAELRRAEGVDDVIYVHAFHQLRQALEEVDEDLNRNALAAVAGLAAHVKEDRPDADFATQMGRPKEGKSSAPVHELRFRRLLGRETCEELYQPLTRVLRLLDGNANLASLAAAVYWWEHPSRRSRKKWAYKYYDAAPKS